MRCTIAPLLVSSRSWVACLTTISSALSSNPTSALGASFFSCAGLEGRGGGGRRLLVPVCSSSLGAGEGLRLLFPFSLLCTSSLGAGGSKRGGEGLRLLSPFSLTTSLNLAVCLVGECSLRPIF